MKRRLPDWNKPRPPGQRGPKDGHEGPAGITSADQRQLDVHWHNIDLIKQPIEIIVVCYAYFDTDNEFDGWDSCEVEWGSLSKEQQVHFMNVLQVWRKYSMTSAKETDPELWMDVFQQRTGWEDLDYDNEEFASEGFNGDKIKRVVTVTIRRDGLADRVAAAEEEERKRLQTQQMFEERAGSS